MRNIVIICLTISFFSSARAGTFTFDIDADKVASKISLAGGVVEVTWPDWFRRQGRLEKATGLDGPWQTVGRNLPYRTKAVQSKPQFYRVRARPVTLHIPTGYDPRKPMPLVIALHFYSGASDASMGQFFEVNSLQLLSWSQSKGFLYTFPDGFVDSAGWQFWSANEDCCDFGNVGVNDDEFLERVIGKIRSEFNVDSRRIYLFGLSNGALMAYEFAAKHPELIAGVVALAPPVTLNAIKTPPNQPVNILHVHGTSDSSATYSASRTSVSFPIGTRVFNYIGAKGVIDRWVRFNGCSNLVTESQATLDLVTRFSGADTIVSRYEVSRPGGAVELWTIAKMDHYFTDLTAEFREKSIDWLLQHPKP